MSNELTDSKLTETGTVPNLVRHETGSQGDNKGNIASGGNATIHDRTALYVSIFSMVLSALCLGLFLMQTFLMPQIIDSKVAAGVASARAGMEQQVAQAQATSNLYRTEALITKDKLEELRNKLNEKGMKIPTLDGHD